MIEAKDDPEYVVYDFDMQSSPYYHSSQKGINISFYIRFAFFVYKNASIWTHWRKIYFLNFFHLNEIPLEK